MKNLVSTSWLENNIENVRVLDGTWHMPNVKRNALNEYSNFHIKNSVFLDLDEVSEQNSLLPHMLPKKEYWEERISTIGIKNSDHVVIYDNSDIISSCRFWYNFLYFGHDPNLVSILNGGLKKWLKEKKETTNNIKLFPKSSYVATENKNMVLDKKQINQNIPNKIFELIDARSKERFQGLQPEPRKELRSGNIDGSNNIFFMELINDNDNTFKDINEIKLIFDKLKLNLNKNMAFTCGSGVTACILGLAYSIISGKNPVIYDGSWCEYGLK
jgi:thiosulfate/3-mercaptopyruvate sulfurtransferase